VLAQVLRQIIATELFLLKAAENSSLRGYPTKERLMWSANTHPPRSISLSDQGKAYGLPKPIHQEA